MHYWVVRAGEGGKYYDEFIKYDVAAIGWDLLRKSLKKIKTRIELEKPYKRAYPKDSDVARGQNISTIWRFLKEIQVDDYILTPNPLTRTIYIGRITSDYFYNIRPLGDMYFKHRRKVKWEKEVSRDVFSQEMKNALGALMAVFNVDHHEEEIENALIGKSSNIVAKGRIRFPKKPKEDIKLGEPIDFEGLTNAPKDENGVIFLFGKLHDRMGIRIRAIRKGFPDAIGEVYIKDELYPRSIEFEYRSSDFKRHDHDPKKCDIIVCWEHDWRDCPSNIFIIELKKEIESYIS